jgi:hypothetical protein
MSCVGAARCEQSCYDEARAHRQVINTFLDDIHRPALPYKFKFKFSGCPNDCMNSHPACRHGRHRHLARQHAQRRGAGAQAGLTSTA